jgi:hypothetical protein
MAGERGSNPPQYAALAAQAEATNRPGEQRASTHLRVAQPLCIAGLAAARATPQAAGSTADI